MLVVPNEGESPELFFEQPEPLHGGVIRCTANESKAFREFQFGLISSAPVSGIRVIAHNLAPSGKLRGLAYAVC